MGTFLESLRREEVLRTGEPRKTSFLDSHPPTPERAETTANRARTLTWARTPDTQIDRDVHLRSLDGLVIGRNPAHGVFRDRRFLHPTLNCTAEIPAGWTAVHVNFIRCYPGMKADDAD